MGSNVRTKITIVLVVLVIVAVAIVLTRSFSARPEQVSVQQPAAQPAPAAKPVAQADYVCAAGRTIKASFFEGAATPVRPGEPPVPTGKVELALSDGRQMSLPQTISASGIRYATSDESIVFWGKGEGAFITEGEAMTYADCAEIIWTLGSEQLDRAALDFLLSRQELSWQTDAAGKNFCVFQNLAPENELFPRYLWVRCGEFKMEGGQLTELSGTSVPLKLDYPNELSYFDRDKFSLSIPRDGSLYDKDVKTIFPPEIWDRLHFESGPLNEKIRQQALEYFGQSN